MEKVPFNTIIIFTENKSGILYRIADVFLKRKINIESLTVSEIEEQELSRFTIVIKGEISIIEKVVKQLYKIVEVTKVIETVDADLIYKEVALFKVSTVSLAKRKEVEGYMSLFDAKVVSVGEDYLIVEKTGTESDINSLHSRLVEFGIKEYVRSGRIALMK
jgi:acetolactate synthase-1/3 small subunit